MTAYVYFYLIAIVTLRVKSHSLQERIVLGNLLIVDHQVIYIYSLGQEERPYNAISDKNKT